MSAAFRPASFQRRRFPRLLSPVWAAGLLCLVLPMRGADTAPANVALDNGMRVLTGERRVNSLAAIDLWVRAGAREERPGEEGSAHFLEHTLFKGTRSRQAGQIDVDIENLGGTLNAATGPDYAHFYVTVPAAALPRALDILADVVQHATLPAVEIDRERGVILDELAEHDSSPTAHLIDLLYARAFPALPYGHSPGGASENIRVRRRDTLAAFYARCYRPERCTLVVVGDVTPQQTQQAARQAFGAWQPSLPGSPAAIVGSVAPKNTLSPPPNLPPSGAQTADANGSLPAPVPRLPVTSRSGSLPDTQTSATEIEENADIARPLLGLAFPGPPARDHAMTTAALLVAELLGESRGYGRLAIPALANANAIVRYKPRLDFSLWMLTGAEEEEKGRREEEEREQGTGNNVGALLAAPNTNPAPQPDLLAAPSPQSATPEHLNTQTPEHPTPNTQHPTPNTQHPTPLSAVVADLRTHPPTRAELQRAKNRLLGRLLAEQETGAERAQAMGYADVTGGDTPDALRRRIRQTTLQDIQQFIARYLLAQPGVTVHLRPRRRKA